MQLDDIKKLATLARIDMSESEIMEIAKDFDAILSYVGQVKEATKSISARKDLAEEFSLFNVMRDDAVTNNEGAYSEKIIKEMPDTQDGFLKVKQIL